jgi:hypothetical protein
MEAYFHTDFSIYTALFFNLFTLYRINSILPRKPNLLKIRFGDEPRHSYKPNHVMNTIGQGFPVLIFLRLCPTPGSLER